MRYFGNVLYLCDGKACDNPTHCRHNGTGECRHTAQWEHALHPDVDLKGFVSRPSQQEGKIDLWEPTDEG